MFGSNRAKRQRMSDNVEGSGRVPGFLAELGRRVGNLELGTWSWELEVGNLELRTWS